MVEVVLKEVEVVIRVERQVDEVWIALMKKQNEKIERKQEEKIEEKQLQPVALYFSMKHSL